MFGKIEKYLVFTIRDSISKFSSPQCTKFMTWYLRRHGMIILGLPNYLSPKIWFDGTDYSRIELNEGCTISSYVRILTHDWSLNTIAKGLGLSVHPSSLIGIHRPIRVGRFSFIGTCSVLMPGASIGEGVIVGAGSVVRGNVAPWTIVAGSPAVPVGDSRELLRRNLEKAGKKILLEELVQVLNENGSEKVGKNN